MGKLVKQSMSLAGVESTILSAKAQKIDVVIIDTAGRLHNKVNLMNELSKIKRVMDKVITNSPHEILLVLDGRLTFSVKDHNSLLLLKL